MGTPRNVCISFMCTGIFWRFLGPDLGQDLEEPPRLTLPRQFEYGSALELLKKEGSFLVCCISCWLEYEWQYVCRYVMATDSRRPSVTAYHIRCGLKGSADPFVLPAHLVYEWSVSKILSHETKKSYLDFQRNIWRRLLLSRRARKKMKTTFATYVADGLCIMHHDVWYCCINVYLRMYYVNPACISTYTW